MTTGLHKVAAENNLSATAFLLPKGQGYEIRWFTARCELKLCGHATLASGFVVLNFLQPEAEMVRFESRFHGTLTVEKSETSLSMNFPALFPQPRPEIPRELTRALSRMNLRPSEVWEVNQIYMLVLEDQRAVQNMTPDFEALQQLHPHAVLITATRRRGGFRFPVLRPRLWNRRGSRDRIVTLPADPVLVAAFGKIQVARAATVPARRRTVV